MEPPLFVYGKVTEQERNICLLSTKSVVEHCHQVRLTPGLPLEEGGTALAVTEGVNSGEETFVR